MMRTHISRDPKAFQNQKAKSKLILTHSICMSLMGIWVSEVYDADDFLKRLSVKYLDLQYLSHYII